MILSRRGRRRGPRNALVALALLVGGTPAAGDQPTHDRAYWLALRAREFRIPAAQPVLPLALEPSRLLGTTDPELRDPVGYEALATWVYRDERLGCTDLARLRAALLTGARAGLGEPEGDALFGRSFSVLALSVLRVETR